MPVTRYPPPADFVYHDGDTFRVEWYYTAAGEMPAKTYYEALDGATQQRLGHIVRHMADKPLGTLLPKTLYRVEDKENKIYAFKPKDERFFNFTTEGRRIIITNAYHKHSQQMTKADMEKLAVASKSREDYLRRVQEGTYYEDQ
jgi:hypothetical protein